MTTREMVQRINELEREAAHLRYILKDDLNDVDVYDSTYYAIKSACEKVIKIEFAIVAGKWRKREVVDARHLLMVVVCNNTKLSLTNVGRLFGGRDHSTVIWAKIKHENLLSINDKIWIETYDKLSRVFNLNIRSISQEIDPIINPS